MSETALGAEIVNPPAPQKHNYADAFGEDGDLLTMEEKLAARKAMRLFQDQEEFMRPVLEQARINEAVRRGVTGGRMVQDPTTGKWRARLPRQPRVNVDVLNKAASLCRSMTGILTADPPAPEATPGEGSGDDPDAAEFATRALTHTEMDLGRTKQLTWALDLAHTFATTFEHFWYDPHADGRVPIEIEAGYDPATGEEAQTLDDAEDREVFEEPPMPMMGGMGGEIPGMEGMGEMPGIPPTDPMGGLEAAGTNLEGGRREDGAMPPMVGMGPISLGRKPWPKFRTRYLHKDGSGRLTDDKKEAQTRWQGRADGEVVKLSNVRLYPHTATDIDDAHGAGVLTFVPFGKLKSRFQKEIEKLSEEDIANIFAWQPEWTDSALPVGLDRNKLQEMRESENRDEWPVPVLTTYFDGSKCPGDYPKGVYMIQLGETVVLHRDTWEYEDHDGIKQPRMIPLSQMTLFREGRSHWAGVALMEIVGPGNEARAAQLTTLFAALDRIASQKTFVPTTSVLNLNELKDPNARYIAYNATGGEPRAEQLSPYPTAAAQMFQMLGAELDDISGLRETGQGLEASNVTSGVQAMAVISQVQAALSPQARAVIDCYLRGCRIELEIIRANYSKSRQIGWVGEDGRYKQKAWERSDLGSTKDVQLKPSTMTMLRPAQKAILAKEFLTMGVLPPDDFRLSAEKNLGGLLALQDNPFRMRIRRQIEDWKSGPPEDWQPPPPQVFPVMQPVVGPQMMPVPMPEQGVVANLPVVGPDGQPQMGPQMGPDGQPAQQPVIDPNTGQPAMQPQMGPDGKPILQPDPALQEIFAPVPSDALPAVAPIRLQELARLTATLAYSAKPPEWRRGIDEEMARMQQAVQQVQMAQQAQGQQGQRPPRPPRPGGKPGGSKPGGQGGNGRNATEPRPMNMATAVGGG